MKSAEFYWEHPLLQKLSRVYAEGDYLFRQGEIGDTMFILRQGIVELLAESDGRALVAGIVQAGEFLGEKSIVSNTPQKRFFSARAKSEIAVFELRLETVEVIQKKDPALMNDLLRSMFQLAAHRLDRANQLAAVLRSSDNFKRLVRLIYHTAKSFGRTVPEGTEFVLDPEMIRYFIDMAAFETEACLRALADRSILLPGEGCYLLRDEDALLDAHRWLRDSLYSLQLA